MSWYKEGSVNIVQGSNTVIGVGTKWTNPLIGVCAGQMLILKTANTIEIYEIASIQSDTLLTLANQYSGASKTGVSYEIPTDPKVSIEALALRISEMLNYYQQQMNGWQSILTGTGDITLTAPDGRIVTIKSQRALTSSINHALIIGDQRLMAFRANELPIGWYFRSGDNYLLSSPQGQVLNSLSAAYKADNRITVKTINGQPYINVPNAFHSDGRGLFERPVNGVTRQVGSIKHDAIRNIHGAIPNGSAKAIIGHENITKGDRDGAISVSDASADYLERGSRLMKWAFFDFDASRVVPTGPENTVINEGKTPAIYLGV